VCVRVFLTKFSCLCVPLVSAYAPLKHEKNKVVLGFKSINTSGKSNIIGEGWSVHAYSYNKSTLVDNHSALV
jgi:hypothetical protein